MSSLSPTTRAGISSSAFDAAFTSTTSPTGETTVRFGDGVHGAAPPHGFDSIFQATYAAGGGASGNVAADRSRDLRHEVLVAFEPGQMHSAFNTGLLWHSASKPPTSAEAARAPRAGLGSASSDLDSMSDMGEMESLRLQMAMDRLSKMMSVLSNLLQRIATTATAITQNLK